MDFFFFSLSLFHPVNAFCHMPFAFLFTSNIYLSPSLEPPLAQETKVPPGKKQEKKKWRHKPCQSKQAIFYFVLVSDVIIAAKALLFSRGRVKHDGISIGAVLKD